MEGYSVQSIGSRAESLLRLRPGCEGISGASSTSRLEDGLGSPPWVADRAPAAFSLLVFAGSAPDRRRIENLRFRATGASARTAGGAAPSPFRRLDGEIAAETGTDIMVDIAGCGSRE